MWSMRLTFGQIVSTVVFSLYYYFFFSKILDKEIVVKSLSRVLFQLKDKGNFREFLVGKVSWLIEFPCITRFRVMNMFCGRTSAEKQIFVREILGGMEIGHGSDLSVTAGSVPADLHLSSKGLFFMFELNCPKQRALSTLAEVMIAILKRELATFPPISNLDGFYLVCFVSIPRSSSFLFFFFLFPFFFSLTDFNYHRNSTQHSKLPFDETAIYEANNGCRDSLLKGIEYFMHARTNKISLVGTRIESALYGSTILNSNFHGIGE